MTQMTHLDVGALRARLSAHGIPAGHGDTFDTDVAAAVTTFQERTGLPPIGVAGPQTRHALYRPRPTSDSPTASCTRPMRLRRRRGKALVRDT